mgnify:CR=1 FL=1
MIQHVVLLRWNKLADADAIAAVSAAFAALPAQIPQIKSYHFGPDKGIYPNNADYALIATFDNAASLRAYVSHPAHLALLRDVSGPIVESFSSAQFTLT